MIMPGSRAEQQAISNLNKKIRSMQPPLLESAPSSFAESIVSLAVELIVVTNSPQNRLRSQRKFRYDIHLCIWTSLVLYMYPWQHTCMNMYILVYTWMG